MYFYYVIGLITGALIGVGSCGFWYAVNRGINIKIFGLDISIKRVKKKKEYSKLNLNHEYAQNN